jgi:hypothetical protein
MSLKQRVFDCQKVFVDHKAEITDPNARVVIEEMGKTILYLGGYIEQLEKKVKTLKERQV